MSIFSNFLSKISGHAEAETPAVAPRPAVAQPVAVASR